MARKTTYREKIADAICLEISTSSKSMKTICEEMEIPVRTVLGWLQREETFKQKYARAKEQQADFLAEEILEIADDGTNDYMTITKGDMEYNVEDKEVTNRSKLRVDARKWVAAHLKPKKYADRIDVTSGGEKLPAPDYSKLSNEEMAALAAMKMKLNGSGNASTE